MSTYVTYKEFPWIKTNLPRPGLGKKVGITYKIEKKKPSAKQTAPRQLFDSFAE